MNKLGQYDDGRSNYNFSFGDGDGKHISISFRAEPDYDLDIIFNEFRNFLIATGHDVEGQIGELGIDEDDSDDEDYMRSWDADSDEVHAMTQAQSADKFSMDHLPNNGWPFGGLTTEGITALTTEQIAALTVKTADFNQYPTMSPITQEQIKSWRVDAPGTAGSAKVNFK
jgi:hypothetical protein